MRLFISFVLCCCLSSVYGQEQTRSLNDYIAAAKSNSPLLQDYRNRQAIQGYERQRLKAFYTHSKVELNGSYLFVPVVSREGGKTTFLADAQDGTDYYGYDLGVSSGQLQAGVTWTQPLLGKAAYRAADEQAKVDADIWGNQLHLEQHQLERSVTEQYILCLLDKQQLAFTDSIARLLQAQQQVVEKLATSGLAKQSDLHLITIEQTGNAEQASIARQSYRSHVIDLNILCGIHDTAAVSLMPVQQSLHVAEAASSAFLEQYRLDSLSAQAALHGFDIQYKPQLNLFVDGGLRSSLFQSLQKRLGMSAGITFSWALYDGHQRRRKAQQTEAQLSTIRAYRENFVLQNGLRKQQYIEELKTYDERQRSLEAQRREYVQLLTAYEKEIRAGQRSVLDYMTVLRNRIQTEKDYLLLQTNRELLITAYNYWNW